MIGDDHSITQALILVITLIGADIALSVLKHRWPRLDKLVDDVPLIIVSQGKPLQDRMRKCNVDEADVMEAARKLQGLERMDQIKFAILEQSGGISIIPNSGASSS
jgi:uncharacterized membrane protein YcaP (DUF421 family)